MAVNQFSKGPMLVAGATFGGVLTGTVSVDPASVAAGGTETVDVSIDGVVASDIVSLEAPATLEDGLVVKGVRVKAGGVDLDLYNPTGGAIDGAALDWTYKVLKVS